MNPITFPGLGLSFQIDRVAFSVFGRDIYWYGVIIAIGFVLGILCMDRLCKEFNVENNDFLDVVLWAAPLGIVGARIYYVLFYLDLYTNTDGSFNFGEAIAIWDGGLAIYGGILSAIITCFVVCKVKKISFPAIMDLAAYGLLIGQCIGRWGNFVNQEAYGGTCTAKWRMGLTLFDGSYIEVHPTFLYESLWNFIGFLLLYFVLRKYRKFDGMMFCCYLCWYGFGRFFIESLRSDSLYLFSTGLKVSQCVAIITFTIAAIILVYNLKIKNRTVSTVSTDAVK